jgi:hypothetical protein
MIITHTTLERSALTHMSKSRSDGLMADNFRVCKSALDRSRCVTVRPVKWFECQPNCVRVVRAVRS